MVTLYDHNNRPIRSSELKSEVQSARIAHLHQEFADHPSRGLTPAKLAQVMEQAEQGDLTAQARLAEDMEEKDAHLYAELSKRKRGVLTVGWDLVAPEEASAKEQEEVARIEQMLKDLDFDNLLLDLSAGILPGYACIEIEWDFSDRQWMPKGLHFRPADWFTVKPDERDVLRLRAVETFGEELRPFGWIVHHHKAKSGYLARGALCRILAWPFLFRNFAARDLAEFLEIYGLPLRLGTYPPGSSDQEKATLMRAVVGIGHAAAGIIPEGMAIEFQEAAKGASDPFMAMMEWAERSLSKAIVGGTLTSGTDRGGAYALGQVHQKVFADIVRSDLRQYAATLTRQLVRPLCLLNTTLQRLPSLVFDLQEPEDLKTYAEAIPKLVTCGMKIPQRWVRDKLKIPEAEGDEPVLENKAPVNPQEKPNDPPAVAAKGIVAATTNTGQELDAVDRQVAMLELVTEQPVTQMVQAIRTIVEQADSLSDLSDRLLSVWPDMDAKALAEAMTMALSAAHMAGRYDILEGL